MLTGDAIDARTARVFYCEPTVRDGLIVAATGGALVGALALFVPAVLTSLLLVLSAVVLSAALSERRPGPVMGLALGSLLALAASAVTTMAALVAHEFFLAALTWLPLAR